jgi:hypothetical protein
MATDEEKRPDSEATLNDEEAKKKDAGFLKNYGVCC